jgi:hypothetical protein
MTYEVRNSHNDIVYKNEDKRLAIIQCDWLSDQNIRLTYIVVEVKEVYRKE